MKKKQALSGRIALAAINEAARKAGMSYGQYVARTTEEDREAVINRFTRKLEREAKKSVSS